MSMLNGPTDIDLTAIGERKYLLNVCNRLWLPKFVIRCGVVCTNPLDAILAIRFDENSAADIWALKDGYRNTESGDLRTALVTVLTKGTSSILSLMTGIDVIGGYCNGDGLSPAISDGATESILSVSALKTHNIIAGFVR